MTKCSRRPATDPQKLKNCQRLFFLFLLVEVEAAESEAIGVKAEAVDEIAASTSLRVKNNFLLSPKFFQLP